MVIPKTCPREVDPRSGVLNAVTRGALGAIESTIVPGFTSLWFLIWPEHVVSGWSTFIHASRCKTASSRPSTAALTTSALCDRSAPSARLHHRMRLLSLDEWRQSDSGLGMENTRLWTPSIRQPLHPRPREAVLVTPMDQHGPPEPGHPIAECGEMSIFHDDRFEAIDRCAQPVHACACVADSSLPAPWPAAAGRPFCASRHNSHFDRSR
jgi:hypothetical protein